MPASFVELNHRLIAQWVLHDNRAVGPDGDDLKLGVALPLAKRALQVAVSELE